MPPIISKWRGQDSHSGKSSYGNDLRSAESWVAPNVTNAGQWERDGGEAANYGGYGGMDKLAALIIESLVPTPAAA